MKFEKKYLWMSARDYVMITFGIFLYVMGFTAFILPEKVVIGGVSGVSSIGFFAWGIPVALTQYAVNMALLALAWRTVGRTFVIRTIIGTTIISALIAIFQPMFPAPLVPQQTFMNVILGAILCGFGLGIVFVHNGSTGGTDIIAAMVAKKTNVSIGRTMIYVDFCIISSSWFLFGQLDKIVYGLVVLAITSFMCDFIINTNRQAVQFTIFSEKWREIASAINTDANRGCTVCTGMGWYTRHEVKFLMVMCRKIESVTIFRIIKSIDPNAFITQANVNGVYGKGFDKIKLRTHKHGDKPLEHVENNTFE